VVGGGGEYSGVSEELSLSLESRGMKSGHREGPQFS
jgi:hypothetical protein